MEKEGIDCSYDGTNIVELTVTKIDGEAVLNTIAVKLYLEADKTVEANLTFDVDIKIGNSDGSTTWIWGD